VWGNKKKKERDPPQRTVHGVGFHPIQKNPRLEFLDGALVGDVSQRTYSALNRITLQITLIHDFTDLN